MFLIDAEDAHLLTKYSWFICSGRAGRHPTVRTRFPGSREIKLLHREIMGAPNGVQVDHINGNSLDNRRCNLRLCSGAENSRNKKKKHGALNKYKGVYKKQYKGLDYGYQASIRQGKKTHTKFFKVEEEAARWYNDKAKELFGEFAGLNII